MLLVPRSRVAIASYAGGVGGYSAVVLGTEPANLIGYWPLNEASGAVADNLEGTAARDGAYTGVTLGQSGIGDGWTVPLFDGSNDYCSVYSASFASAWDGLAGTFAAWAKVSGAGVWTDSANRNVVEIAVSDAHRIIIQKASTNNQLGWHYIASGSVKSVTKSGCSSVGWMHVALTWDYTADEVKAYCGGVQEGSTQTSLAVWVGSPASTRCTVGSKTTTPSNPWSGYLGHAAVWTKALTAAQILALATV